jgi:hypothetical protein
MGVVGQRHSSAAVSGPGTYRTAGWACPRVGVDRSSKSGLHQESILGMSSPLASCCTDDNKTKYSTVSFYDGITF